MSIKKCITKSQSKEDTWPNRYWSVVIFARPRRSQNNPARGSENHAPLHHPLDFAPSHSLSTLFLSLFLTLSFLLFPTPLVGVLLLVTSHGLSWPGCQSVPDSDSARSKIQLYYARSLITQDYVKARQSAHLLLNQSNHFDCKVL